MYYLIDNYDSFTYNLFHYMGEIGANVEVFRNDAISVDQILADYKAGKIKGVILSPGPCTPNEAGICLDLIEKAAGSLPILGVCLGHQSIGQVYGGKVIRAPYLMHGKVSDIYHQQKSIFAGFDSPFRATRYHSLIVEKESLPDCLEITAETEDGLIMGLSHKSHPVHGVQFHPESIESQNGHALLQNFIDIATEFNAP
ncbi:anthranilate synthase component II [Paremcibacter congregatus]|uniref:Aminodeoxychorismate/anthranilate synthase component II n=1 Tax=Paremcibacter congregatus TaxID=2043170 RepID=A0A2G4YSP2_9PROT|nr:aminodeoxychorismate/anthranilate synthase component II [Paremcibacter congregatus]PHZ85358.1 aminodeoxychorismate/anthranilate synthase component II [Paremcibacter congregatus]QDE27711.1 aminodeoxychorismate/anthranilate synthase component II [Paremcibacter congregatus]